MAIILPHDRPASPLRHGALPDALAAPHLRRALLSIGRIEVDGHPYLNWLGPGFLVAPRRVLTARHVAGAFCQGDGDVGLDLGAEFKVYFSAPPGLGVTSPFRLPIVSVRFIHPHFDVALCEVGGGEIELGSEDDELGLTLSADVGDSVPGKKVAVFGFAAPDRRNDPDVIKSVYGDVTGALYFQPGEIREATTYFGAPALAHDCSTVGGSAGAPLIDLGSGLVLGVHYAGLYLERNFAVPSAELARDSRVRSHGVMFSDDPPWMNKWLEREFAYRRALAEATSVDPAAAASAPPRVQPPEVDAEVRHFSQADLYRLKGLLADAGFAREGRQYLLFISMNTRYVSMLPTEGAPDARLLAVLDALNHTAGLTSGELPFRTLLVNAVENSKPLPVSKKLQAFLDQLPAGE